MDAANQKDVMDFARMCKMLDGVMKSPIVWGMKKAKTPKYMKWQIFISLQNANGEDVPIRTRYIKGSVLPSEVYALYWTVSGQENGKMTKSQITAISEGKNIGKSNETTALTQAILDARSEFNLKLKRGGSTDKTTLIAPGTLISFQQLLNTKGRGETPWRVHQMALQDVSKTTPAGTSNWRHMTFPGYIQPKYDGTRFTVVGSPLLVGKINGIDGFSRGGETYAEQDHILQELLPIVKKFPELYLDGELWKEGYGLQFISGSARRLEGSKRKKAVSLDFYIFDCFYLDKPLNWTDRMKILEDIKTLAETYSKSIKFAPNKIYNTREEALKFYQEYVDEGYEGGVLRNADSKYEYGLALEIRSYTTMKIKPMSDEDWPVIGFTCGEVGKDVGALVWVLEVTPDVLNKHNEKFETDNKLLPTKKENEFTSVTKGLDYEERYAAFAFLKESNYFDNKLKNKLMRVQYSIISAFGKPQQPKVLGFRDLELNKTFLADLHQYMESLSS